MDVDRFVDVEAAQPDIAVVGKSSSRFGRSASGYAVSILLSVSVLAGVVLVFVLFKEYLKAILSWVDAADPRLVWVAFLLLFVVVSFPVALGYLVLVLCAGYLLGAARGLAVTVLSANVGVGAAHYTLRALRSRLPLGRLLRGETARALLKVISGPQAFKIVFFARLTPIPFGLQNTIFALSEACGWRYHVASALGLLPAQTLHVYLGSTLRSLHDVLHAPHTASYLMFAAQVCVGGVLLAWVVTRARRELALAVLAARVAATDSDSDTTS